jgi:hypothetical protein
MKNKGEKMNSKDFAILVFKLINKIRVINTVFVDYTKMHLKKDGCKSKENFWVLFTKKK